MNFLKNAFNELSSQQIELNGDPCEGGFLRRHFLRADTMVALGIASSHIPDFLQGREDLFYGTALSSALGLAVSKVIFRAIEQQALNFIFGNEELYIEKDLHPYFENKNSNYKHELGTIYATIFYVASGALAVSIAVSAYKDSNHPTANWNTFNLCTATFMSCLSGARRYQKIAQDDWKLMERPARWRPEEEEEDCLEAVHVPDAQTLTI